MKIRQLMIAGCFVFQASISAASVDWATVELRAKYSTKYNGMKIDAIKTLSKNADNEYEDRLDASSLLGKIQQIARFTLDETGQLVPLTYLNKRTLLGIKRSETQTFDWAKKQAIYMKKGSPVTTGIELGVLDLPTHYLQLRRDLHAGRKKFEYELIRRGQRRTYAYRWLGKEHVNTSVGELETDMFVLERDDQKRQTKLWLASNWGYLLVKLEQTEEKDHYTMQLEEAVIAGQAVTPKRSATKDSL